MENQIYKDCMRPYKYYINCFFNNLQIKPDILSLVRLNWSFILRQHWLCGSGWMCAIVPGLSLNELWKEDYGLLCLALYFCFKHLKELWPKRTKHPWGEKNKTGQQTK